MQAFSFDAAMQKACDAAEKIQIELDKISKSKQYHTMSKTVTFTTAVILTVGELRKAGPFSIYNVTSLLRNKANCGDYILSDKTQENVHGVQVYRIEHSDVKALFNELLDNGVLSNLKVRNVGAYNEYSNDVSPAPVSVAPTAPTTVTKVFTNIVDNTKKAYDALLQKANVASPSAIYITGIAPQAQASVQKTLTQGSYPVPSVSFSLPSNFDNQLIDYVEGQNREVTLKEVQSRFKGIKLTCEEYAKKLSQLGYVIVNNGPSVSKHIVQLN